MSLVRKIEDDVITFFQDDEEILWLKETLKEDTVTIAIGGSLISETKNVFLDELLALVSVGMNLELDMKEVKHVSAGFMQVLIRVELEIEKINKQMKIRHLTPEVETIFEKTGAMDLLLVE